jgi:hypothetical protein
LADFSAEKGLLGEAPEVQFWVGEDFRLLPYPKGTYHCPPYHDLSLKQRETIDSVG